MVLKLRPVRRASSAGAAGQITQKVPRGRSDDAILRAAKALFLDDGFDGVNLDRVAEVAGVSRQTVYNRFGSKEAVFRAMIERHWKVFGSGGFLSELTAGGGDPEAILRYFANAILRFVVESEQIAFTRLVIAESRRLPWIGEEFYRFGKEPAVKAFVGSLEKLTKAGKLSCPHPEIAAHQFLGLLQEFFIWPKVMAIGPAAATLPSASFVIDEAVAMFLSRYRPKRVR